ncbi:colorectal cancer-associated protein 2 [Colossoma macropomum]|uniref:colorectal cancer-associated protein 2 n=1 Tax=Colossoma macropomum TaxID=42526 RepID=UPI001864D097|nr:colorectal cancer-associated protein 2 [Colossoma macropomum]
MSDKPKVYQGVRVKTTVKELLQKRRALQAAESRKPHALPSPDACPAPLPAAHGDAFPASSAPDAYFQPRHFANNGHVSMEDTFDQHFLMSVMPSEGLNASSSTMCSPAAWMDGYIPACTDYYSNTLASSSPTHSFNLPSPADYNSYSPPESHSSSSSCYSSPSRLDLSSSFAPESCHYQHCDLQRGFCHWPALQDAGTASEYSAYSSSDCFYPTFGDDFYFRRESSSAELCYL